MKRFLPLLLGSLYLAGMAAAEVTIDQEALGKSLGGWKKRSEKYAQYEVSGVKYRTYRPESTVTPDGGTYVSVRIDHLRGVFSSDDHAMLEISIDRHGHIASAKSSIAIQGRSISSDVIEGANKAGQATSSIDKAVQIGTDLVSNLSSKLLRSKVVEPGRVAFPSAVRHNYNLLYQAIRLDGKPVVHVPRATPVAEAPTQLVKQPDRPKSNAPLTIQAYRPPDGGEIKPSQNQ